MFKQDTEENQLIDKVVHINRVAKVVKLSDLGLEKPEKCLKPSIRVWIKQKRI